MKLETKTLSSNSYILVSNTILVTYLTTADNTIVHFLHLETHSRFPPDIFSQSSSFSVIVSLSPLPVHLLRPGH